MLEHSAIQFRPKSNLIISSRWVTYNVIGLSFFITLLNLICLIDLDRPANALF